MADSADDPDVFWVEPKRRGVLPLDDIHCPRRLARTIRQDRFKVTADQCFADIMHSCSKARPIRPDTWINQQIIDGYTALHDSGHAHSIEVWDGENLVGGLYGVSIGGAFFGESMFSAMRDASKIALMHLIARLKIGGYVLLDTQFFTDHLGQFGAIEMTQADYLDQLAGAVTVSASFNAAGDRSLDGATVLQSITQTS